jgi:hypothetical protein
MINSCRKPETELRSSHEQCSRSEWLRTRAFRLRTPRGDKKKFCAILPRNPLKSLDSDERIQGNPRKSKPCFRAVRGKTAMVQENPIPSNCEALRCDDGPDPLRLAQSRYISPSACPAVTGRGLPSSSMATKVKVASVTFSRSCVRRRRAHASTWTFIEVRPTPSMAV